MSQIKQVIIAELYLDSGTEYLSGERVRRTSSPPIIYSGTVQHWGLIEKSIPCPAGMPQISNATIRISDHYRHWRDTLAQQSPRRRIMRITVLPEGASVADYDPIYVGEVIDARFGPAYIEIELRDRMFAWVDEELPAMVIPEIYEDVHDDEVGGFVPIVVGNMIAEDDSSPSTGSPQGLIPLPHVGLVRVGSPGVLYDRWAAAMTPVLSITLYRREITSVDEDVTTPEWVTVAASEYTVREVLIAAADNPYGAFDMTHTVIDFDDVQPDGTEIRAEMEGIYERGTWGGLAAVDGSLASPQYALRNPIDAFINLTFLLMRKAGVSVSVFDTVEIGELRDRFEDLEFYADFAITEAMTGREWLGQFLAAFCLDMFVNRNGLITLRYTRDTREDSPPVTPTVFKEGKHILRNSFFERLPEQVVTQLIVLYQYNNATQQFAKRLIIDTAEQALLATTDEDSPSNELQNIAKAELALYAVRDDTTAAEIATRHIAFLALGSYTQEFQLPAPAVMDDIELAALVALTHSQGLGPGGYTAQQVKILGTALDLAEMRYTIHSVLYPPQTIEQVDGEEEEPSAGSGRPTIIEEWEDPTQVNPIRSRIIDGDLAIDADAGFGDSLTYAECQIDSTRPTTPNYAQLFLYGFPEPDPPVGQSLQTAEIFVVVEYVLTDDSGGIAGAFVEVFNDYHHDYTGSTYVTTNKASLFENTGATEPGIAKAEYSNLWTGAEFAIDFPGGAADIYVRAIQWHSLFQNFPATIKLRVYDCWIEYTYA